MRDGQSSPRAQSSNGCHSPVLNLSKSGNEGQSGGGGDAPSDHSHSNVHSPNPSIHDDGGDCDDDDNISDGNVSEVDEHNDKDDDGESRDLLRDRARALKSILTFFCFDFSSSVYFLLFFGLLFLSFLSAPCTCRSIFLKFHLSFRLLFVRCR